MNSFWLILIILIQIILIETIIVVSFIKKSDAKSSPIHVSSRILKNKPISNTDKIIPTVIPKKFSMGKENNSFFSDIYQRIYQNSGQPRDIRLPDDIVEEDDFKITAYDLSYECCGKYPDDPEYGITFSGKKAVKGVTIAVDPEIIPIGSNVYIELEDQYSYLNGWYVAEDTGEKVKGNIIDIFFGKTAFYLMEKFGRRNAKVKIITPSYLVP